MSTSNIDRQLDLAIDALNREQPPGNHDGELSSLINTVRLLKSLRPPAEPDASFPTLALDRIMASLDQPVTPAAEPSLDDDPPRGISGRTHKYSELAAILVIGLAVIGGVFIYQTVWPDDAGAPAVEPPGLVEGFDLYRQPIESMASDGTVQAPLLQINPDTLEDLDGGHSYDLQYPLVFSQDGSTLVLLEHPEGSGPNARTTVIINEGLGGPERLRFELPMHVDWPRLSDNGSRLLLQGALEPGTDEPPFWYIFDTATGDLVSSIQRENRIGQDQLHFSADGSVLYRAWMAPPDSANAPEPLQLFAYDVLSGEIIQHAVLEDVLAAVGNLDPDMPVEGIGAWFIPPMVVSPDGSLIAIAHADSHSVTTVTTSDLRIEETFEIDVPETITRDPGRQLSIIRNIQFSTDGRHLYLASVSGPDRFGLLLIDIEQQEVITSALEGAEVQGFWPAPDGINLYVTISSFAEPGVQRQVLHRLDAGTLEILAERHMERINGLLINPRPLASVEQPDTIPTPDESGMYRDLTYEQAQELVPFELVQPSVVPEPLEFGGILVAGPPRPNPDGTVERGDPIEIIALYRDSRSETPPVSFAEFRQGTDAVLVTNPDAVETRVEIGGHTIAKSWRDAEDGGAVITWRWESAGMHYTITARSLTEEFEFAIEELIAALPEPDAQPVPDASGTYRDLTWDQAQNIVPFELVQPPFVPDPLEFVGINIIVPVQSGPDGTIELDEPTVAIAVYGDSRTSTTAPSTIEFRQAIAAAGGDTRVNKAIMEQPDGELVMQWNWGTAQMSFTITASGISQELEFAIEELIGSLTIYR